MTDTPPPLPVSPCLVLLCKRPALGHSKQRLAQQIGAPAALQIAQGLLDCAIEDLQHWPDMRVISPDSSQELTWAQSLCPSARVLAQIDGNLGQRLNDLDRRLRAQGLRRLVFIGSDCPALRPEHYARVAQLLTVTDTVLLNALDGGVVLMASNLPWPDLSQLPWSTAQLGKALTDCCLAAGHSLSSAGTLCDVDYQEDLPALNETLATDNRPARKALSAMLNLPEIVAHV